MRVQVLLSPPGPSSNGRMSDLHSDDSGSNLLGSIAPKALIAKQRFCKPQSSAQIRVGARTQSVLGGTSGLQPERAGSIPTGAAGFVA